MRTILTRLLLFLPLAPPLFAQDPVVPDQHLDPIIVSGNKVPAELQDLPFSATPLAAELLRGADVRVIQDAVRFTPNTFVTEFSARKLSNPRFRGLGSSPLNPGITTVIDGVPVLNANASNINFLNVRQIELVRGPQSTLFGRNNIGGVILVESEDPTDFWSGGNVTNVGSYNLFDTRSTLSGPLSPNLFGAFSSGYETRDGYHVNDVNGNAIDTRESYFGKAQLLYRPDERVTLRWNVLGEVANDGDYGLHDLASLRSRPFRVARDFEGFTKRDLLLSSFRASVEGEAVDFNSTSGFLWWNTVDATDLDYSPFPLITRNNEEDGHQFTQEFRLSSPVDSPIQLGPDAALSWQTGLFLFSQEYDQVAGNRLSPFITRLPFPVQDITTARLNDWGAGLYGQGTLRVWDAVDLTAGLRGDYEDKEAELGGFTDPLLAAPTMLDLDDTFVAVSPSFAVGFDVTEPVRLYAAASKGYKAGGFNPIFPAGRESFAEETSWNYESGVKTTWKDGRVRANAAFFYTQWDDLQLNSPVLAAPGRFFVENAGRADSKGIELDVQFQPHQSFTSYVAFGVVDTQFLSGSTSDGTGISGNVLPYSPDFTTSTGAELSVPVGASGLELFGRADLAFVGQYAYDASNAQGQDAYTLADFRLGLRRGAWFLEGWVRNAFDEDYIPIAIPYALSPSGYIGENGAPTTFGLRFGVDF